MNEELTKLISSLYGSDWKAYGPYVSKEDGRKRVVLSKGKQKKTRQYCKILMEIKLGRFIVEPETVDHIDRDKTNDDIDNLRVIDRSLHSKIDAKRVFMPMVNCIYCNKLFTLRSKQLKKDTGPFCSKVCSGKFSSEVQYNGREKEKVETTEPKKYYYEDKS